MKAKITFRYFTLSIVFQLISISVGAQNLVEFEGVVRSVEDSSHVSYVHVYKKSTGGGTTTSSLGQYKVVFRAGDTLVFSALGYQPFEYSTDTTLETALYRFDVWLRPGTLEIDTATVYPFRNPDEMAQQFRNMELEEEEETLRLNIPTPAEAAPSSAGPSGLGLSKIVPFLYKGFDKITPQKEEIARWNGVQNMSERAKEKYNPEFVSDLTGLKGEELEAFMEYCSFEEDYILQTPQYDLALAVRRYYNRYLEEN